MRDNKKLITLFSIAALMGTGQSIYEDQIQLGFQMETPSEDALVA